MDNHLKAARAGDHKRWRAASVGAGGVGGHPLESPGLRADTRDERGGETRRGADALASLDRARDESGPRRVALLVDYPVLLRAVRVSDPDLVPDLSRMVRRAMALGAIFTARAYGAWYDTDEARVAYSAGIDPVFVPPVGPGSVPSTTALVADGQGLISAGQVQALALCGDDRLLPLAAAAHAAGLPVALIAHRCAPDGPCVRLATFAEPAAAYVRVLTRAEKYRRPPAARSA